MITKRGDRYQVKVYDPATKGKRTVGTFATEREAKRAEREAELVKHRRPMKGETGEQFAARWLVEFARPAASTRKTYAYALRPFREKFGSRRLDSISRLEARSWALEQPRSHLPVISSMFTDALNVGLVEANPFRDLRIAKPRTHQEVERLTASEIQRLASIALEHHEEVFGPTFAAMILVSAYTGIRPGEMFALEPKHVARDELYVRQALDSTGQIGPPKNGKAREVVLPEVAFDAIQRIDGWQRQPYVFQTKRARRFAKTSLNFYWTPVRAIFGQPTMRWYSMRHTCASLLLEAGLAPWEVAVQLGHTDGGQLVMSTYGHPSEDLARDRIRMALSKSPDSAQGVARGG